MAASPGSTITEHFATLTDPRVDHTKRHQLLDLLTIALCAILCGADEWVAMEEFGNAKREWFDSFLDLPNGIPSHDTFGPGALWAACLTSAPGIAGALWADDGGMAVGEHDELHPLHHTGSGHGRVPAGQDGTGTDATHLGYERARAGTHRARGMQTAADGTYMATLAAVRYNPVLKSFYTR